MNEWTKLTNLIRHAYRHSNDMYWRGIWQIRSFEHTVELHKTASFGIFLKLSVKSISALKILVRNFDSLHNLWLSTWRSRIRYDTIRVSMHKTPVMGTRPSSQNQDQDRDRIHKTKTKTKTIARKTKTKTTDRFNSAKKTQKNCNCSSQVQYFPANAKYHHPSTVVHL